MDVFSFLVSSVRELCASYARFVQWFRTCPQKKVQQNIYTKNIFDFDPVRVPILIVCNLQVGVKIEENKQQAEMKNQLWVCYLKLPCNLKMDRSVKVVPNSMEFFTIKLNM